MTVTICELSLGTIPATSVTVGETWRVYVSFKYTSPGKTAVTLQAAPYTRVLGVINRVDACLSQVNVDLEPALTPAPKEAAVDIYFKPQAQGGIADGTYGLIAEVPGKAADAIDDCLVVAGNPAAPNMTNIFGLLVMVMMMGMVTPMMEEV